MEKEALQERKVFLASFLVAGFFMKIVAEFVHEVCGHGFFVWLFGGEITSVYISLLWPYELSYIGWVLPSTVTSVQRAWISASGILVCLCASFLTQAFLFVKMKIHWRFAITIFWFAFWTLVNSTGYLLIGGLEPFGDVYELIELGVLTSILSLTVGFIMFVTGFVTLSWILRRMLIHVFPFKKACLGVTLFWLIIPALVVVMLANPERGLQWYYLPLTFTPTLLSLLMERFLVLSKR